MTRVLALDAVSKCQTSFANRIRLAPGDALRSSRACGDGERRRGAASTGAQAPGAQRPAAAAQVSARFGARV